MTPDSSPAAPSKATLITGRILSYALGLMLIATGALKFTTSPDAEKALAHIGLAPTLVPKIGVLEIICTLIYLIPQTAVLGAILLTGYFGGAILTHLRVGDPFVVQIILGVVVWLGLYLREPRLRALLPLRR